MILKKMFALIGLIYILSALGVIICVFYGAMTLYAILAVVVVICVSVDSYHLEKRLRRIESQLDKI